MYKTVGSVIGLNRGWALLVGGLGRLWGLLVTRRRRLLRVGRRIWIAHKVSRGGKACGVWLLLALCLSLLTTLCLRWEDRVREGGRCGWIGSVGESRPVIIEIQIEPVAIVVVLHLWLRVLISRQNPSLCRFLGRTLYTKFPFSCVGVDGSSNAHRLQMEGVARNSETLTSPERQDLPGMRDPSVLDVVSLLIEQSPSKKG